VGYQWKKSDGELLKEGDGAELQRQISLRWRGEKVRKGIGCGVLRPRKPRIFDFRKRKERD